MTGAAQSSTQPPTASEADWSGFRRAAGYFGILFALVWVVLYLAFTNLPYVRNGADIIHDAKSRFVRDHIVFDNSREYRVAVFGNSRTLAGFRPAVFDQAFGGQAQSYNFGLPADDNVLPILEDVLKAGNRPTHVLVQSAWPDLGEPNVLSLLRDSQSINRSLFPFRNFPRDLVVFSYEAFTRRGWAGLYAYGARQAEIMLDNRGWYFIEGQSRFPDHRLPAGYSLPTDTPHTRYVRPVHTRAYIFKRLMQLCSEHGFALWLVPSPFRSTEFASPHRSDRTDTLRGNACLKVLGTDYLLYSPTSFSDPIHLNPSGSEQYTRDLATLFSREIE
jgi:hypothetical protein